jgi:LacI family transcriptional regulator
VAKRIASKAEALGYKPNRLAASLRLGRSDVVGVLLPDIANPVFAPILGGITEALSAEGYAPIVADAGNATSQQISFVETLLSQRVDGLIPATVSQDDELVGFCIQRGLPVVLVNRSEARDRVSSVVSDDDMGMRLAVDHLVGLGHRHIAHVAGPLSTSTGALRRDVPRRVTDCAASCVKRRATPVGPERRRRLIYSRPTTGSPQSPQRTISWP